MPRTTFSAAEARRIGLAAQGFGARGLGARPDSVGTRQLNSTIARLGLLQLDSVNVFERSHYLPLFARLGSYDKTLLDRLTFAPPRLTQQSRYIEYWAHEAALIPLEDWPLFRWRMEANRAKHAASGTWYAENTAMVEWLRAELAANGPFTASTVEHESGKGAGGWWGWSDVKLGLEYLFRFGEAVSAGRTRFERTYALAETALPPHIRDADVPTDDAVRELMLRSARAHGIGTLSDLADYYRIKLTPAKAAMQHLLDAGEVTAVTVDGWDRPAFLHRDARMPRRIDATALLSPFDPVVWHRDRGVRMFDFFYRIEIYTPEPQRQFGYYTLPLLLDDRIVGRVDLKSDRKAGILRVQSAWTEPDAPAETAARLAVLLRETAAWQGLGDVTVRGWGNLAPAVAAELGVPLLPR